MRRTKPATPEAAAVHEPHALRPRTVQQQIAASAHQRHAARQILEESRRLSDVTRQRLMRPPRVPHTEPDT